MAFLYFAKKQVFFWTIYKKLDTFLYSNPENCTTFFVDCEENLRNIGLHLKKEDCKVISGNINVECLPIEIERVGNLKALGVPIGDDG